MTGAPLDFGYHAPGQLDNVHQILYDAGALRFQGTGKLHPMTTCPQRQIGVQWLELVLAQPRSPWKAILQGLCAQCKLVEVRVVPPLVHAR
jgi:hypothetical protein